MNLVNNGFGTYVVNNLFLAATPKGTFEEAKVVLKPFIDFIATQPANIVPINVLASSPSFFAFYRSTLGQIDSGMGRNTVTGSRLVPATKFDTAAERTAMVNTVMDIRENLGSVAILLVAPWLYSKDMRNLQSLDTTSVNPAWRNAVWHVSPTSLRS